jgi:hypothetical protein
MTTSSLLRLSGLVLAFAAMPGIAGHWLHPGGHDHLSSPQHPLWVTAHSLLLLSYGLSLLTLPALYGRLAGRGGVFGLVAFVLTFAGLAYGIMGMNVEVFVTRPLALDPASADAALQVLRGTLSNLPLPWVKAMLWWGGTVGAVLFGVFLVRCGQGWRHPGLVLLVGSPLYVVLLLMGQPHLGYLSGFSLLHVGLALAGVQLWRSGSEQTPSEGATAPAVQPAHA